MIDSTIVRLTFRQLLGQKRTILMAAFALLPVLIALLVRVSAGAEDDLQDLTASVVLDGLVVGLLLPFTALVFGTAALGTEFEDGTAVYLLSKPIPRATVVVSKLLVAWLATMGVVLISTLAAGLISIAGEPQDGIVLGFAVGVVAGSLVYCSAFIWLSIATSRALIAGLLYVFIWENVVVGLFEGVRVFSIRAYTAGIASIFMDVPDRVFEADLAGAVAAGFALFIIALTTWLAIRALSRWEIGEAS